LGQTLNLNPGRATALPYFVAMKTYPVLYTLKVWLSSVLAAPYIGMILEFSGSGSHREIMDMLCLYIIIIVVETALTFFVWVVFWGLTEIMVRTMSDVRDIRLAASLTGLVIASLICWLIDSDDPFSFKDIVFDVALGNCFCIFAGCWYFNIASRIPNQPLSSSNTDEHEQTTL
jgi:hypothetical protein